jgi:hypothetical protein
MGIGIRLRTLWHLKLGVIAAFLVALTVAVWSVQKISVMPPKLTPRSLEMASASTHVLIDTPKSALLDRRQDTYSLEALTQRAILLGNVIANGPVRETISERTGVPAERLQIEAPLTRAAPQANVGGKSKSTSDILDSTEQYRLSIVANPTVPLLDIYAQAPTAKSAEVLANTAVDGLRIYLADIAVTQKTPEAEQIRLVQLGRARGEVINEGVAWQVAFLTFVLTFAVACACVALFGRVREGWRRAERGELGQEPLSAPR